MLLYGMVARMPTIILTHVLTTLNGKEVHDMHNYSKTLFVGADVALDSVAICFLDYMGNKLSPKRLVYPNNLPGSQELAEQIAKTIHCHDLDAIKLLINSRFLKAIIPSFLYVSHFTQKLSINYFFFL